MTDEQMIEQIDRYLASGTKSAQEIYWLLRNDKKLPPYWSVIDVADFLRDWYGQGRSHG